MSQILSRMLGRKFSFLRRNAAKRPLRNNRNVRLALETLEDRTLLTTWHDIAGAFNNGVVSVSAQAQTLADNAFKVSIPLVQSSSASPISQPLDVAGKFQTPFGLTLNANETNLDVIRAALTQAGFHVDQLDVNTDSNGNLVRLTKDIPFSATQTSFSVGGIGGKDVQGNGLLGFNYFDDQVNGSLTIGALQATVQPATFHITFGVDLDSTQQPQLFVQDSTRLDFPGITGQTHLTGRMNLRNLLNVDIAGDAVLSLGASLSLHSPNAGHKLHLSDLTSTNVIGNLTGSAEFANVSMTTQLPVLPALRWRGNFIGTFNSDNTIHLSETTVAPDVWGTLRGWVSGLSSITPSLDFLRPISSALNYNIPLFNFSLGDKLGLGDLSQITSMVVPDIGSIGSDSLLQSAETALNHVGIYVGISPDAIPAYAPHWDSQHPNPQPTTLTDLGRLLTRVVSGERVDLLSFSKTGGDKWGQNYSFTFLSLGVPGVADVHLDATFGGHVGWDYSVGFGLDTTGFYIDPRTHIGVSGGIYAGLHGGLRVLGFDLASADGRIGMDASARLSMRNPDPSQGERIYLDQIFRPGENLFQSFLNDMQVNFTLDVSAHVEAKLDLWIATITLFSHDWDLGRLVNVQIPVATTQTKRGVPLALHNLDLTQDPAVSLANGVLTLNGQSSAAPNLVLLSGRDGTADVNWSGHGIGHFTGVSQVRFLGGSGNDIVQVKPGFNIPIYAQGGSGSNYFEAGDGDSTLMAGGHADPTNPTSATLVGGAGRDSLIGGPGNNLLEAGSGDSTLIGGNGNATLYGGRGHDLLIGGASADANDSTTGHVYIQGGSGDSTIWAGGGDDTIVAGTGTDQIHGGRGNDLILAGATSDPSANPVVVTGGGDDTVWGGSGHNTIRGGAGNDLIYGGSGWNDIQGGTGNNTIYGGPNSDLLIAGTGNDRLYSGSDYNHKTTLVAGSGEDWLYAGQGDDLLRLPFGVNHGGVRSHFVGGPGHDTLAITTDATNHIIRLTQSSATDFTATSYTDPTESQVLDTFDFEVPSDLYGNFIQTLALEAITGNNKLDVAPQVSKNVELIGGTGNDTLIGGGGNNTLIGGTGNDLLIGYIGIPDPVTGRITTYNEFHGGTGTTTMIGGNGDDVFYGGIGDSEMDGGNGRVIMYGGKSLPGQHNHDTMRVGDQSPQVLMVGGANDVTMYGGTGKNVLLGGAGQAEMHAGIGDANLVGGAGADTMYGGTGYDVLIGGQGDDVMYASDPSLPPQTLSPQDWQARFVQLHNDIQAVAQEEERVYNLLQNPNLTPTQRLDLQAREDQMIGEDRMIAQAIVNLDNQHDQHDPNSVYRVANMFVGGAGHNQIYGNANANFLVAGNGPDSRTSIYGGGGDDTVTGTAGKDTFFMPPAPDNATIVFTAQQDNHGNTIPAVTIDAGGLHEVEYAHIRGITQIGVITGAGNNQITVDLNGHVLQNLNGINVQCTNGNNTVELSDFPGMATVQAGSGNDQVDLTRFSGIATVQAGTGNVTVKGGNTRGLELDGGTGISTYEVDGNGVQILAEGSPSMLSVYVDGQSQPQTKITRTTFRRLSVQGQAGNNPIVLGPLRGFTFPELIANAGAGNKHLDASALTQRVTLLGGTGNDTFDGGSGPNYMNGGLSNADFRNVKPTDTVIGGSGNDEFEWYDNLAQDSDSDWAHRWIWGSTGSFSQSIQRDGNPYMYGISYHGAGGALQEVVHTFTKMGTYNPSVQGPITRIDADFGFESIGQGSPINQSEISLFFQQGNNYWEGDGAFTPPPNSYLHYYTYATATDYQYSFGGGYNPPNFSASGGPISFGFATTTFNWQSNSVAWLMDRFHLVIHSATPSAATTLRVTPSSLSPVAGAPSTVTLTALDGNSNAVTSYRGTVHFSSTDPAAVLPPDYTFTAADNGVHTFPVTLKTAGNSVISVVQSNNGFPTGIAAVTVLPAVADHFQVSGSAGPTTAGTATSLTVRAVDAYGNIATGYHGTVHFTSTDGQAGLPADYTFTVADNGVHTFSLTPRTAGSQTVTVRDLATGMTMGQAVTVVPTVVTGFRVTPSTTTLNAGATLTVTVQAVDPFGNVNPGYRGTVHPPASDGQTTAPADYTFTAADNGTHTFSLILTMAGSRTIALTDTSHITGSAPVNVAPLAAVSYTLVSDQWSIVAGTQFQVTLTALDRFQNIATGYSGTVHFSTTDPLAGRLPGDYTFTANDHGVHTFAGLAQFTAGFQVLTVADGADTRINAAAGIAVTPAAADHFRIDVVSAVAGIPFDVTVTALDAYGNIDINYSGTVTFSVTDADPNVVVPLSYTFTADDAGVHTFSTGFVLVTPGDQTITLTDDGGLWSSLTVTI